MLELQRPDSLVVRVVNAIRTEINSGQPPPESRLPTEQQLAEQLNVSRSVVREAIAQLKADGVLTARAAWAHSFRRGPLIASVLVVVFALFDQGRKHSAFKN